ncbi:MAG: DctP family TRAP transporter solute-binding subunit [Spirochaetaceae bacterium]|nr:MAG: DctP family TRAP transporter solute-binding subunit [Spirochaetaceae bacterium]
MARKILLVVLALVLITVFSFATGRPETEEVQPVTLTFSSVSVPGDAHTIAMSVFKEEVERLSGGQIQVDVYHSGALFSQEGEQTAVRRGTVDMVYTAPPWLSEFVPYLSMFGAAYTFSGYDHMTAVYNGEIGDQVFQDVVDEVGVRPLTAFYLGTRQLNLTERVGEIRRPDQMRNVKLRVPGSPAWIAMGRALGANPTPMAFTEVYLGLRTGAIDGQDNPLPTNLNAKFYEVTKYIVLTDHVVDTVWPTINEAKWQTLTAQQQEWVLEALELARQECDRINLENEAKLVDYFRSQGLTVIEDPDKQAFMQYARNFYLTDGKEISTTWDLELYDRVQAMAR